MPEKGFLRILKIKKTMAKNNPFYSDYFSKIMALHF